MQGQPKYSRVERERRFLVDRFPVGEHVARMVHLADRYIDGTTLRLREWKEENGRTLFKLTQKIPNRGRAGQQGFITTMYLSKDEFDLFVQLPAAILNKTRYSVPPFGIDVFENAHEGLILAETEFSSEAEAAALTIPSFVSNEVTEDDRFTGGRIARASREEVKAWLSCYGKDLTPPLHLRPDLA